MREIQTISKHVESAAWGRLDRGSTPLISTKRKGLRLKAIQNKKRLSPLFLFCLTLCLALYSVLFRALSLWRSISNLAIPSLTSLVPYNSPHLHQCVAVRRHLTRQVFVLAVSFYAYGSFSSKAIAFSGCAYGALYTKRHTVSFCFVLHSALPFTLPYGLRLRRLNRF